MRTVITAIGMLGTMLVLGSAGALEMSNISMLQFLAQSLLGILLMSVSLFFSFSNETEEVER